MVSAASPMFLGSPIVSLFLVSLLDIYGQKYFAKYVFNPAYQFNPLTLNA